MKTYTPKVHLAPPLCRSKHRPGLQTTTDREAVTCRDCRRHIPRLERIERDHLLGHQDRNGTDLPVFRVTAEPHQTRHRHQDGPGTDVCSLIFTCPRCGTRISHTGTWGAPGYGDGHRAAHCSCWPRGYYIREDRPAASGSAQQPITTPAQPGTLIHKPKSPLGWVQHRGIQHPVWVCSRTGRPISPTNPGTLYFDPATGDMEVWSDAAGDPDPMRLPFSTELHVHTRHLMVNTTGQPDTQDHAIRNP